MKSGLRAVCRRACRLYAGGDRNDGGVAATGVGCSTRAQRASDRRTITRTDEPSARHALPDGEPRIVLNDGVVSYNDRPILHHLSWRVNPGEHWQIVGPNGAGKSTLLSLITGDHPQGYSNDLTLFGRRRGSGETIWDIKNISATSAAVYIWITASVPRCAMSFSPAISILSAFTVPFQTGNENWRNSGWIFWESISVRRMPFHSLSGTAAAGADRARAG